MIVAGDAPIAIEFDFESDEELPAISFQRSVSSAAAANNTPRIPPRPTPKAQA